MISQEFSLTIAESLFESDEQFPVDLDFAWVWLGFTRKENCLELLKNNFVVSEDFHQTVLNSGQQGGRPANKYYLTIECFKSMGMMAGTDQGKTIRRYFLECERVARQKLPRSSQSEVEIAISLTERVCKIAGLAPELIAQSAIDAALAIAPRYTAALEPARQQIINSTASSENLLTPTQIGKQLGISAIAVNKLLISKGFQIKNSSRSSSREADYLATDLGKDYSQVVQSAHGGSTFQQLRWFESVVDQLQGE